MPKLHPVTWKIIGNGHHMPLIWQQSFTAKKQSSILLQKGMGELFNKKSHIIISRMLSWIQKVQFCHILNKNMVLRADIRLKNWHWSSNAKKWVFFLLLKMLGDFFHIFISHQFSWKQKVQFCGTLIKNVVVRADIRLKNQFFSSLKTVWGSFKHFLPHIHIQLFQLDTKSVI